MAYVTIAGIAYLVREGDSRGRVLQIENRRRAIDGGLLVDSIATKREVTLQLAGLVSAGRNFTIAEANALIAVLTGGSVAVAGDIGSFTARARDIGYLDEQDWRSGSPVAFRIVTATLEEV